MRCYMKRNLLLPVIFLQALSAQAFVTGLKFEAYTKDLDQKLSAHTAELQSLCSGNGPIDLENVKMRSHKIWKEVVDQINNARITAGISVSLDLGKNYSIGGSDKSTSEPSIGGKFSGKDDWNLDLNGVFLGSEEFGLGAHIKRQFTFIQQFDKRCESIARLPYDPITKLPITAERALARLKPGDFFAFTAPLTLFIGSSGTQNLIDTVSNKIAVDASIFVTGEFDIHIYRMQDNYVRVRFFANKSKGIKGLVGFKVFALDKLLGFTPLEIFAEKKKSNLFTADYIFKLDNQDSAALYNKLMAKKFEIADIPLKATNPFGSDDAVKKLLYTDLSEVQKVSQDDLKNLPIRERRIIRLADGKNVTRSDRTGIKANIIIGKVNYTTTHAESDVVVKNIDNQENKYKIKTVTRQQDWQFFSVMGQEDSHNTAFLLQLVKGTNGESNMLARGLQSVRLKEQQSMSKEDVEGLQRRLTRSLPEQISSKLILPDAKSLKGEIKNAMIEQSMFINAQVLSEKQRENKMATISQDKIRTELTNIIQTWGKISAKPSSVLMSGDQKDPRMASKEAGDIKVSSGKNPSAEYLEAFSWDLGYIPTYLEAVFNERLPMATRLDSYDKLLEYELFNEVGTVLVLRLIPAEILAEVLTYRLEITGRGIEPKVTLFPANADETESNIFKRILDENNFLTDRTFNLKYYMSPKGEPLTLEEVIELSK